MLARHDEWTLTLDIHNVVICAGKVTTVIPYTRIRAPYINPANFRFSIYRKNLLSEIGKFLGMQDIDVGHPEFDDQFIIKGNDPAKVRLLFQNALLRESLASQREVHFAVKDDEGWFGQNFPADVDELQYAVRGSISEVDRLKSMFDAFMICLDSMHQIGEAEARDPGMTL